MNPFVETLSSESKKRKAHIKTYQKRVKRLRLELSENEPKLQSLYQQVCSRDIRIKRLKRSLAQKSKLIDLITEKRSNSNKANIQERRNSVV